MVNSCAGKAAGASSGRPCTTPTSHSKQSTSRGPGRLNIWLPSTSHTRPFLTARSSCLGRRGRFNLVVQRGQRQLQINYLYKLITHHQGWVSKGFISRFVASRSRPHGATTTMSGSEAAKTSCVTAVELPAPPLSLQKNGKCALSEREHCIVQSKETKQVRCSYRQGFRGCWAPAISIS